MKLIYHSKHQEYDDIWTFRFEPMEPVSWIAGQSIRLELPAGFGTEERRFSIVSAPYENDISITTRISQSDFKQALSSLEPGGHVDAYGINGDFVWDEGTKHRILGASGIGITAFVPMLKQLLHDHKSVNATLLYANRDAHFIFRDILESVAALHPEFAIIWLSGERLSAEVFARECPEFATGVVYLSGPSAMVDEVGPALQSAGLSADNIKSDWFTGRPGWDETSA